MEKDGCQLYAGAKVINCEVRQKIIVGEDSFVSGGKLEDYVQINRRNMIVDSVIGTCTYTGMNTVIKQAQIGKYCSISWNVSITGNKHDYKRISPHPFPLLKSFEFVEANTPLDYSKVSIGNDVWIGTRAIIKKGVTGSDIESEFNTFYQAFEENAVLYVPAGSSSKYENSWSRYRYRFTIVEME